jgi:hypothetical protein
MSKSSSCVVTLRRFGVWRGAVTAVAGAALAALVLWTTASLAAARAETAPWILATAFALGLGAIVVALSLVRVEGGVLAYRDGRWTFAPDRSPSHPLAAELAVALDLGSFLLLTLAGPAVLRRRWLPVQRRGLERDWHALRCAVYSPPLAAAAETLAANENPP